MSDAESIPLELAVEAITNGLLRAVEAQSEVSGFAFDVPIITGAWLNMGSPRSMGGAASAGPAIGATKATGAIKQGGGSISA